MDRVKTARRHVTIRDFYRMNLRGGWRHCLRGLDYVRCLEFPLIYNAMAMQPHFRYLDVGSGQSVFPLVVAMRDEVRIVVVDQGAYVNWQLQMAQKLAERGLMHASSFHVLREDAMSLSFRDSTFDRITAISTLEHIEGDGDSEAIRELSRVLAPNGRLLITVPYNYDCYRDCYVEHSTYSARYVGKPLFFQRHYDDESLESRLIKPSGLRVVERTIFGEAGFPFFNTFYANAKIPVPLKLLYTWLAPVFAKRFLRVLKPEEVKTKPNLPVVTTEGAFLILTK